MMKRKENSPSAFLFVQPCSGRKKWSLMTIFSCLFCRWSFLAQMAIFHGAKFRFGHPQIGQKWVTSTLFYPVISRAGNTVFTKPFYYVEMVSIATPKAMFSRFLDKGQFCKIITSS